MTTDNKISTNYAYATTATAIDTSALNAYVSNDDILYNSNAVATDRSYTFVHTGKTELNIPNGIKVIVENDVPRIEFPSVTDVNIVVPNKVVEVTFADGTKEKSVCREPDVFSLESAISICISKKIMCGSGAYNNAIRRGVKVYEDKLKKEEFEKTEKERIEKKRAKRLAYKERRAAKREELDKAKRNAEKEEQIEIQKEAYIRAMEYMNSKGCVVAN